jgi:hypothetical protein
MGQQTDDRWTTKAPKGRERTKGGTAMRRRGGVNEGTSNGKRMHTEGTTKRRRSMSEST